MKSKVFLKKLFVFLICFFAINNMYGDDSFAEFKFGKFLAKKIPVQKDRYLILGEALDESGGAIISLVDKNSSILWSKTCIYGKRLPNYSPEGDTPVSACETKDGGFVVMVQLFEYSWHNIDRGAQLWLIKLNSSGKKLWERIIASSPEKMDYKGSSIIETSDGSLAIAGTAITYPMQKGYNGLIIVCDSEGNVKWKKIIEATRANDFTAIYETTSGFLALGCDRMQIGVNLRITAVDKNGKLLWQSLKGNPGEENENFSFVLKTADKGFLIGTEFRMGKYNRTICIRVAPNGKKTWEKNIYSTTGYDGHTLSDAIETDNGFILVGKKINKKKKTQKRLILGIDSNGNKVMEKFHELKVTSQGVLLLPAPGKSFLVLNRQKYSKKMHAIGITAMDFSGNILWSKSQKDMYLISAVALGNGIYCLNATKNYNTKEVRVVIIDKNGNKIKDTLFSNIDGWELHKRDVGLATIPAWKYKYISKGVYNCSFKIITIHSSGAVNAP